MMEMTEKCLDIPQVMNAILEFQPISLEWGDFSQIYFLVKKSSMERCYIKLKTKVKVNIKPLSCLLI